MLYGMSCELQIFTLQESPLLLSLSLHRLTLHRRRRHRHRIKLILNTLNS